MRLRTRETASTLYLEWEREPSSRRWLPPGGRRLRWAALILLLLAALLAAVLGIRLAGQLQTMNSDLHTANAELLDGVKILQAGGTSMKPADAAGAARDFASAGRRFGRWHAYLQQSRVLAVLGVAPPIGRQLDAARRLTDIGERLAHAGGQGVEVVNVLLAEQAIGTNSKKTPAERMLAVLSAAHTRLPAVRAELAAVARDRAAIPSAGLLPELHTAVVRLDAKFGDVNQLVASLDRLEPGIAELLGANGPRTYLVLQQDPAEIRATGGFIGSIGFLSFDHGTMAPYRALDIYAIDHGTTLLGEPGYVPPPGPIDSRIHPSTWELRDANWSPDFPTAARQAASFYQRETGAQVDGVIAIDPYFMSRLLSLVGSVSVPETGDVLTPANFFEKTLFTVETQKGPGRKNFLSYAARPIFERLTSLSSSQWGPMLQVLAASCQQRSLQAYFNRASAQGVVEHFACGGEVRPAPRDGLMVVDSNLGGNKDDFWLKRSFDLTLAPAPDGSIEHTLVLHYDGRTVPTNPLTGLYIDWIRVYVPNGSRLEASTGASLAASDEAGRLVIAGWMQLNSGQVVNVRLRYRTPPNAHDTTTPLTLHWQKQPGRPADSLTIHWQPTSAAATTTQTDLKVDRELVFNYR